MDMWAHVWAHTFSWPHPQIPTRLAGRPGTLSGLRDQGSVDAVKGKESGQ